MRAWAPITVWVLCIPAAVILGLELLRWPSQRALCGANEETSVCVREWLPIVVGLLAAAATLGTLIVIARDQRRQAERYLDQLALATYKERLLFDRMTTEAVGILVGTAEQAERALDVIERGGAPRHRPSIMLEQHIGRLTEYLDGSRFRTLEALFGGDTDFHLNRLKLALEDAKEVLLWLRQHNVNVRGGGSSLPSEEAELIRSSGYLDHLYYPGECRSAADALIAFREATRSPGFFRSVH